MSEVGHGALRTEGPRGAAAARLLTTVRVACEGAGDFPARLAASLRAALGLLASEPELACELTVDPYLGSDEDALDDQRELMVRLGRLLRDAAASDPRATPVELSFLAPFLIAGVRFRIGRLVLDGEAAELPRLLPGLLEGLLSYYFEPGESQALTRAALDG